MIKSYLWGPAVHQHSHKNNTSIHKQSTPRPFVLRCNPGLSLVLSRSPAAVLWPLPALVPRVLPGADHGPADPVSHWDVHALDPDRPYPGNQRTFHDGVRRRLGPARRFLGCRWRLVCQRALFSPQTFQMRHYARPRPHQIWLSLADRFRNLPAHLPLLCFVILLTVMLGELSSLQIRKLTHFSRPWIY